MAIFEMKNNSVFYEARLRKKILQIGRVKNPKLKSISASSYEAIETALDAMLITLINRNPARGSRIDIKPPNPKLRQGKANYADAVSNQMLTQLSVVEGLLQRVANLERGQEFIVSKFVRLDNVLASLPE
jgi:hypothetical protein